VWPSFWGELSILKVALRHGYSSQWVLALPRGLGSFRFFSLFYLDIKVPHTDVFDTLNNSSRETTNFDTPVFLALCYGAVNVSKVILPTVVNYLPPVV
jgi:hypothetical protein